MTTTGKRRRVDWFHRNVANPLMRPLAGRVPGVCLLETTGRRSGLPRHTPVGGRIVGDSFWMVSNHGTASQFVRNIEADPRVRVRVGGRWHTGVAHLLPDDDPRLRLRSLPATTSPFVRAFGTDPLTIRVDLDRG